MNTITYINHATVLIQFEDYTILTDPVYTLAISYYIPRLRKRGIPFDELPPIDFILLSHNDYDHLNMKTLRQLSRKNQSTVLVPRGLKNYGVRAGFSTVQEMEWWERSEFENLTITCVPAKHRGTRMFWDRNRSIACGYCIEYEGACIYFAGDTAYSPDFKALGEKFNIDVALLPIGAYKPFDWFKDIHLNPKTAIQAMADLRAKHLVPIHWGTFKISDELMSEPPEWLRSEAVEYGVSEQVHILKNGEKFFL
ncbi:MAG: MBL fold metallo-hydrolase [bacterium]